MHPAALVSRPYPHAWPYIDCLASKFPTLVLSCFQAVASASVNMSPVALHLALPKQLFHRWPQHLSFTVHVCYRSFCRPSQAADAMLSNGKGAKATTMSAADFSKPIPLYTPSQQQQEQQVLGQGLPGATWDGSSVPPDACTGETT
eukprot:1157830-Pelagomonas_calceolata.AAC.4